MSSLYYATAAAVARQHGDERRYRISMDAIHRNVEELIEHGQAEDAVLVCRKVIEVLGTMDLTGWVEDAVAEVQSWAGVPESGVDVVGGGLNDGARQVQD